MTHKGSFNFITQTVFSGTIKNWMITIIVSDHYNIIVDDDSLKCQHEME